MRADRAVFTLPCSVTRGLFRDAKLSAEGQRVIGELTSSPVAMVFWHPRKRQWLRPGSSSVIDTDLAMERLCTGPHRGWTAWPRANEDTGDSARGGYVSRLSERERGRLAVFVGPEPVE